MKEVEEITPVTDLKFSANSGLVVLCIMFKSDYFALPWEYCAPKRKVFPVVIRYSLIQGAWCGLDG